MMTATTATRIPDGTIRRILEDEKSPIRFEDFCCDLFSEIDGIDYLGTSRSWDLARDGRTLPNGSSGQCGYICCATGIELVEKARADITRMVGYTNPATLYFCTSQLASEHALHDIESIMRALAPSVSKVAALGAYQLVPLIQRYPISFQRRYAAELLEHAEFLSQTAQQLAQGDVLGMQVALATQFDDSAQALRDHLICQLIQSALSSGPRTVRTIAKMASDALRLPRIIHPEYFREALSALVDEERVEEKDGAYQLTTAGREALASDNSNATSRLDSGKAAVRTAIEQLLGSSLDDGSFSRLWKQLLDEFANLFFAQGLKVIQAISSLTRDEPLSAPSQTFGQSLDAMRERITRLGIGGGRSDSVAQAVVDLFAERDSEAFAWMTDMAVKYVGLCSLGLEPTAQQEISGRLKSVSLVLDTDIVLSYLSAGERPHDAIEETLHRWRDIGGRIVVVPPVLEEAAYHAWISEFEYQEVWRQLETYHSEELHRYVKTAFVRAFYHAADGQFQPNRWSRFIGEYRGRTSTDSSKLRDILEDRNFTIVDMQGVDTDFAADVRKRIYDIRGIDDPNAVSRQVADKVRRDGDIVAYLRTTRSEQASRHDTTVIISSSPILQRAASTFGRELGEPSPVWPIGALAYLVSLVPGVRLTVGVLRNCLFDEGEFDSMDRLTQFAMRVIRQSKEYSIGYSQRPTLKRALQQQMNKAALQRGQRTSELTGEILNGTPENRETLAEVIAEAVDVIQASRSEREIDDLRRAVRELSER